MHLNILQLFRRVGKCTSRHGQCLRGLKYRSNLLCLRVLDHAITHAVIWEKNSKRIRGAPQKNFGVFPDSLSTPNLKLKIGLWVHLPQQKSWMRLRLTAWLGCDIFLARSWSFRSCVSQLLGCGLCIVFADRDDIHTRWMRQRRQQKHTQRTVHCQPRFVNCLVRAPIMSCIYARPRDNVFTVRAFDWYRPRWPWMTVSSVIALMLHLSPNSIALMANYITVVERRPAMSLKYCLPITLVYHFWP